MAGGGHAWQGVYMVGGMHGRGACMVGGDMHGGGHAWWGACMVGGMHGGGGHAWQGECGVAAGGVHGRGVHGRGVHGGGCMAGGMHSPSRYHEIRSIGGCYASYWNAFLFYLKKEIVLIGLTTKSKNIPQNDLSPV